MKKNDYAPLNKIEKINSRISLVCSIAALVVFVLLFLFLDDQLVKKPVRDQQTQDLEDEENVRRLASEPVVTTATVVAVGDNLFHESVIKAGQLDPDNWNYDRYYEYVADKVRSADLAIVDQETVLSADHSVATGYPRFATPTEAAESLVRTGFDVVYSATNHADDYGEDYLLNTIQYWKTEHPEITLLGIHDSQEDADTIKVREVNGIRIAFLSYAYATNGLGFGEDKSYLLDLFSVGSEKVGEMIQKAKEQADVVVFIAHWGIEDEPMPSEYEKQWATFLMQQGVDVCIGGHPHTLQPYGLLSDKEGHEMLLFYSLGNFISGQKQFVELLEGMGEFTIRKTTQPDGTSSVEITDPTIHPMVMHYNSDRTDFRVYFMEDYTEELAAEHGVHADVGDIFTLKNLQKKFEEIMSINVKPSTGTSMLNVRMTWDGTLLDPNGNVVPNTGNETAYQYYGKMGINILDYDAEYDYTANYIDQ